MNVTLRSSKSLSASLTVDAAADTLVVGVWAFSPGKKNAEPEAFRVLEEKLPGFLALVAKEEFKGKKDQTLRVPTLGKLPSATLVIYGLGEKREFKSSEARTFAAKSARLAQNDKSKSLALVLPEGIEKELRTVGEGVELGVYRFAKYMTGDRIPKSALEEIQLFPSAKVKPNAKAELDLGRAIAKGVNIARDLSNEPPNTIYPQSLADEAVKVAKANGLTVKVFDYKEIQKKGMGLIDAVGRGSVREPRLVHMTYTPKKPSKKKYVFVGKGITFDTGGICIKPAAGMQEMKHDMSGAANIVGFMHAIAALKPNLEVHGIFAAAENMPDGNAYRPGDVWKSYDGKSVEIINTDAEGRLVLADALAYARELEPDLLLDNATLTGACMVALGSSCTGWYASNDATAGQFERAVKATGELMWRMPLLEELKDQMKSDVADLKHTGDRYGGSITAALFLREFIGTVKNWVHCDIAGPAMGDRVNGWNPKGATGHAVLSFVALCERAAAK